MSSSSNKQRILERLLEDRQGGINPLDVIGWIVSLVFFTGSIVNFGNAFASWTEATRDAKWPTTEAKVLSALSYQREFYTSQDKRLNWLLFENPPYHFDVVYRYTVDGQSFTSAKLVSGGQGALTENEAERLMQGLTTGSVFNVHYQPENHSNSVIRPNECPLLACNFSRGCVCLMIAILVAISTIAWRYPKWRESFYGKMLGNSDK